MSHTEIIRVMVVNDEAIMRRGLGAFLLRFADLALVGEAVNGAEAVRLCGQIDPDVILMKLVMPQMDGITATRLLRQHCPYRQVLILADFAETTMIQKALKAGAVGYLLKNLEAQELALSVRAAHRGRLTLAPEATYALIQSVSQSETSSRNDRLTARELDVLALLIQGFSNYEIANMLCLSLSTVRFHVSNILAKLRVPNRTKAVALALQQQLVPHSARLEAGLSPGNRLVERFSP